ncbi:unnamed protein product [Mytilus coruscus]|uniref:Uncharacterized protein n=1 Tax=Mytilus coruscus TaxID=42192 RepID=A0A6J8BRQ9_MYTCO|nr:unnamed protein product [Mytilus coruscus]
MDVPLDVQILLETFLNHNSLNRSNEIETLISSKLKKLYGIYDTLLNVYNRNYSGIPQELNTQELSMNYQSIGTAFSIASSSVEEDNCMKKFRSMMTWGFDDLWRNITNEDSFASLDIEDHIDANISRKSPYEIKEKTKMELSGKNSDTTIDLDYEEPESNSSDYDQEENLEDILNELELSNIPDENYEDLEQYFTPLDDLVDLTPIPENPDLDLHLQQNITELRDDRLLNENADSSTNEMTTDFDTHQNSTNNNSSIIDKADISYDRIEGSFGFEKYNPSNPPPATGRDDDIVKLKEVLDDILIKTDKVGTNAAKSYRILFGADNKIGANLLKLMSMSSKYKIFIPEYPILHLKKSKINNICSGYKHAGIIQILKYMRDEEYNEWKKLISVDHTENASSRRENATFLLHYEIMEHCEENFQFDIAPGWFVNKKDDIILNVYSHPTVVLPEAILDAYTMDVGQFLIWKYISSQGLFSLSKDDCPDVEQINGPKKIIRKLKTSKCTTIQRVGKKLKDVTTKERDEKEIQRKKFVAKQTKLADQKSSEMNACQAILKPVCSKPKDQKSTGIQKSIASLVKRNNVKTGRS